MDNHKFQYPRVKPAWGHGYDGPSGQQAFSFTPDYAAEVHKPVAESQQQSGQNVESVAAGAGQLTIEQEIKVAA